MIRRPLLRPQCPGLSRPSSGTEGARLRAPGAMPASGFTLIEVMIVVVIISILGAFAYPSYVAYVIRGFRSEGQQWLEDFAQRQEQYFLDRRAYATGGLGVGANQLAMEFPDPNTTANLRYNAPAITAVAGPPAGYIACLQPLAGGPMASAADGGLCVDSTGLRWRDMNTNGSFESGSDLAWTAR
jgi:type IV pilus assembly protein PilE